MPITTDWNTLTFSVPQGDLTLITGTLYEMNTETDYRQAINAIMASEEGIVFEDSIDHNTDYTVAGVTYARKIEMINGYSLVFTPDSAWTVRFAGSNNNLFDVENGILNQNQVQVISANSAGLVDISANIYQAKGWAFINASDDHYEIIWYYNGEPIVIGITSPTVQVIDVDAEIDLIAETAMSEVASTGIFKYDEATNRMVAGKAYTAVFKGIIGGEERVWDQPVGFNT